MCGCFVNMPTCICCVVYCLYCVSCILSFMHIYSYLFCLYKCKDYCHQVTTQFQLIIIIIIIIYFMEMSHLLTRSGLTHPEVSSKIYHDSFCQLGSIISLSWLIYFEAFYLYVVSSFSCIPVICPKLVLFFTLLQFVRLFCNLSKCILLFFSCISSLMLLFFWRK